MYPYHQYTNAITEAKWYIQLKATSKAGWGNATALTRDTSSKNVVNFTQPPSCRWEKLRRPISDLSANATRSKKEVRRGCSLMTSKDCKPPQEPPVKSPKMSTWQESILVENAVERRQFRCMTEPLPMAQDVVVVSYMSYQQLYEDSNSSFWDTMHNSSSP